MSLLKRLLLSVTVAILVILAGTLAFSIGAARQYLDGQLQSESENAASSLALSLSQPSNQDPVTRELLMMALFDSGQFRHIRLTAPDGKELFARQQAEAAPAAKEAPSWFSRLLPLTQPTAERAVSDGWRQVGQLSVAVDNSYAGTALWHSSVRMTALVLVAGAAWALFVAVLLNWFRRVLREEVSAQVRAIGTQASPSASAAAPSRARVAELSSLVSAIDDTRERVRATEQEQTQRIESLELEVNRDPVTRLPNRRYFVNELRRALGGDTGQAASHGHVLLFRQRDLQALNADMTRANVDEWLTGIGQRVGEILATQAASGAYPPGTPGGQLARLNGSDFVVLLPGVQGPQAMHLVQQIRQMLQSLRIAVADGTWCRWAYALTDYAPSSSVGDVLARLDHALMRAESAGHAEIEYVAYDAHEAQRNATSESQWQHMLSAALLHPQHPQQLALGISTQAYEGPQGREERNEASLELREPGGQTLPGSLFLPVAVRLGLSADFDLRAIALGLQWLQQHAGASLIVRVSLPSLGQAYFLPKLQALLGQQTSQDPDQAHQTLARLILELDAHGVIACPDELAMFCTLARQNGIRVGLRRLDQQPMALAHLHALPLAYVKLGGDFAAHSNDNPGSRHLLQAMAQTAQELRLRVYAAGALDARTTALLRQQGVGVQVNP
jgi:EAL domain-containing protein (putative c-di-GMP-specific phosphodiesterase class I)/GGDEF domain-containing protein